MIENPHVGQRVRYIDRHMRKIAGQVGTIVAVGQDPRFPRVSVLLDNREARPQSSLRGDGSWSSSLTELLPAYATEKEVMERYCID